MSQVPETNPAQVVELDFDHVMQRFKGGRPMLLWEVIILSVINLDIINQCNATSEKTAGALSVKMEDGQEYHQGLEKESIATLV